MEKNYHYTCDVLVEIYAIQDYTIQTDAMKSRIEMIKETISVIEGLTGDSFRHDAEILENLPDWRKDVIINAVDKFKFYERADNYISGFMKSCYKESCAWDFIAFIEDDLPFRMFCLTSDIESLELYFTKDSIIEIRNGVQHTILY